MTEALSTRRYMDPVCQSRRQSETAAEEHTETEGKIYPFKTHWLESNCWGPQEIQRLFFSQSPAESAVPTSRNSMAGKVCENKFDIRSVTLSVLGRRGCLFWLFQSSSMVARYFHGLFMTIPQQRFQYIAPKIHRAVTRLLPSGTIFLPTYFQDFR